MKEHTSENRTNQRPGVIPYSKSYIRKKPSSSDPVLFQYYVGSVEDAVSISQFDNGELSSTIQLILPIIASNQ